VRDASGAINAFVNRCAHRGNLLCIERSGTTKEFSCSSSKCERVAALAAVWFPA
jgi:hypothetical protein